MSSSRGVVPDPGLALLDLYDTALPEVYGYLLSRCAQRALAEDLTAETFLAALQACRRQPPPSPSTGWLVGIARHKLVDHWRALEREERGLRVLDGGADVEDDPWDSRLDGLAVPEVAAHLGRTVHATETLLVRARKAFRHDYARLTEGGPA